MVTLYLPSAFRSKLPLVLVYRSDPSVQKYMSVISLNSTQVQPSLAHQRGLPAREVCRRRPRLRLHRDARRRPAAPQRGPQLRVPATRALPRRRPRAPPKVRTESSFGIGYRCNSIKVVKEFLMANFSINDIDLKEKIQN